MQKILVIDNYDSFTFNLVHILKRLKCDVTVKRNDKLTLDEVENYDRILLSPGPGIPEEAGLLKAIIERFAPTKPILGVCLGHQAIAEVFGGELLNLDHVYHGVSTEVSIVDEEEEMFAGLEQSFEAGRYHSWVVKSELPDVLKVTAVDSKGVIMALAHREYDVRGLQFHPESILTPEGSLIIENWVNSEPADPKKNDIENTTTISES
jgi:anthranilate synthase component 2